MSKKFKFNPNRECEYFPCHRGVDEDKFNCLFCYCPLYMLKDECGGDFVMNNGIKDCSRCTKPHDEDGYDFIMSKMGMVIDRGSDF